MRWFASRYNSQGIKLEEQGKIADAIAKYRQAIDAAPRWSVPWYNLGLLYKRQRQWTNSFQCNQHAVSLNAGDTDAWWNLGIAATALGDWQEARRAWRGAGIEVPTDDGPLDMQLGPTPLRLNPHHEGEVVWAWRVDPARAIIRSVPLPESRHRYGDYVLHDGAPNGYRQFRGKDLPVFDALAVLEPSAYSTFELVVTVPSVDTVDALLTLAVEQDMGAENWSTIRMICQLCSEGRPHEQHEWERETEATTTIRIGIAAITEEEVHVVSKQWAEHHPGCSIHTLMCVLQAQDKGM